MPIIVAKLSETHVSNATIDILGVTVVSAQVCAWVVVSVTANITLATRTALVSQCLSMQISVTCTVQV